MTTPRSDRPNAVTDAALENGRRHTVEAAESLLTALTPALTVRAEVKKDAAYSPSFDELVAAAQAIATAHEKAVESLLDLAADLRMAGVQQREIARRLGMTEQALSAALSSRSWARVSSARELARSRTGAWVRA